MQIRYELPPGRYSLRRERDNAGDSGSMVESIWLDENDQIQKEDYVLEIGKCCRVGSHYARSYSAQDWWLTTPITEFLEVDTEKGSFRFKTNNSVYLLERA